MPILQKAWKAMNLPGKPPGVYEDISLDNGRYGGVAGYRPWDERNVYLSPDVVDKLKTLPFPGHRNLGGLQVLAHEYAHVGQPQVLPKWRVEGGAEAYAIDRFARLLKAMGVPPAYWSVPPPGGGDRSGPPAYLPWTLKMARGPHQPVRQGQFGR
jgi:hypothetical protein